MTPARFFAALIVDIIFGCIFGGITKYINEKNGYYGGFAWGFWLGWIGIVVVACRRPAYRPTRESIIRPIEQPDSTNEEPAPPNTWKCRCGRCNALYVSACVCGLSKNQEELPEPNPSAPEDELKNISLLKEYKELLDSGVITQEEFEAKKKSILS